MPITSTQMNDFIKIYNPNYQAKYLDTGIDLGSLLINEGNKPANSVRADIALCVGMFETDNFTIEELFIKKNPGNIYTVSNDTAHTFADWTTGTRAFIQQLFAYAKATGTPADPIVSPRYNFVTRGIAITIDRLTGRWSSDPNFGTRVKSKLVEFHQYLNPNATVTLIN